MIILKGNSSKAQISDREPTVSIVTNPTSKRVCLTDKPLALILVLLLMLGLLQCTVCFVHSVRKGTVKANLIIQLICAQAF